MLGETLRHFRQIQFGLIIHIARCALEPALSGCLSCCRWTAASAGGGIAGTAIAIGAYGVWTFLGSLVVAGVGILVGVAVGFGLLYFCTEGCKAAEAKHQPAPNPNLLLT